jgi:fucose permease
MEGTDWRRLFPLAFAGLLVLGLGDAMLGVAWPAARADFGQPLAALGEVTLALTVGYLAASQLSGWLSARLGTGSFLALAALVGVVALAGYALAPAWPVFVLSGVMYGFWSGSVDPGINSWIALVGDVRAMNLVHFAYGAGATLGPLLVTGSLAFGLGWRPTYLAAAAAIGVLLLGLTRTRRGWGRRSPARADGVGRHGRQERLPRLLLVATLATFFVYVGVEVGAGQWTFSHLVGLGTSQGFAGATVSAYWGALTAGRLLMAGVGARVPALSLLLASCATALLGAFVYVLLPVGPGALAGMMLLGLGFAGIFPILMSLTPARVGVDRTPYVVGYVMGSANVGASLVVAGMGLGMQALGVAALPEFVLAGAVLVLVLNVMTARLAAAPAPSAGGRS